MRPVLGLALVAVIGLGCGGGDPGSVVHFALPGDEEDYFDVPFPSELRRRADGTLDLDGVPRPSDLVAEYLDEFATTGAGFGTHSAVYFRVSAPIDDTSLPDPNASVTAAASAFLVDLDPESPEQGRRTPVVVAYRELGGQFIGPGSLILRPVPGFPLRGATTYAAVVTTRVRDRRGQPVRAAPAWRQLVDGAGDAAAAAVFEPLWTWLAESADAPSREEVAGATVFRTQDPVSLMRTLREVVHTEVAAPTGNGLTHVGSEAAVEVFHGTYEAPNFQEGTPPYLITDGHFRRDAGGRPEVVRTEALRFALTVPKGTMPPDGWPMVLYAHGTYGDYRSFITQGVGNNLGRVTDASGAVIAQMATVSIDQVLHGPRDPTGKDPGITFFNFQNLAAARDNVRQGAADNFQLLRLMKGLAVTMPDGSTARFDGTRVGFMGHSQGAVTGPAFIASEPDLRAAVLSGAASNLTLTLLGKTEPVDIPALVGGILGEEIDELHPFLNLVQMYFEPADTGNYARLFFQEPAPGHEPKSIYLSFGIIDHYAPVPAIMALAVSIGVAPVAPLLEPILGMDLRGLEPVTPPVDGNVAGGAATGVVCQYQAPGDEGHWVVFDVPQARDDYARFLATAMRDGRATLMAR